MTAQQLAILKAYYDSGMPGESNKAEQEKILNDSFGGDFNSYADWWVGWWENEQKNNPGVLDQYPNTIQVLGQLASAGDQRSQSILTASGNPVSQAPSVAAETPAVETTETTATTQTPETTATTQAASSGMTPEQLAIFKAYYDSGMPGESNKADQEKILNESFGGDFNAYANWWVNWWENELKNNPGSLDQYSNTVQVLGDLADAGFDKAKTILTSAGYENVSDVSTLPLEQGLLQTALPGLMGQVTGDAARQQTVTDLTNQTNAAYQNLGNVLQQGVAVFDANAYLAAYPEVVKTFNSQGDGATPGTKAIQTFDGVKDMTAQQFAEWDYNTFGKDAGRAPYYTSPLLASQNANVEQTASAITAAAQTAAQTQLSGLATSISQMQQNLTGDLAARAAALQTSVATLNQNLTALDETQKQALAQQISTQQANLEQAIAAQKDALALEVQQLKGNSSAAAQARLTALDAEIAALTAAQEPMAQARIQAAEGLTTAINLGLEATKDQLTAEAAQQGFVGGSTMQDAALARAVIGARQQAAQAGADARLANASDTRTIATEGARGKYSIADVLAGEQQRAGDLGATGGYQLASSLAQGQQALGDTGAIGLASIKNATATNRANIANQAAAQTYADTTGGADKKMALDNALAQGNYSLASILAQEIQNTANTAANAKAGNFAQLYPTTLNAAQIAAQLPASQAAALTSLLPYGNAGLTNAQNALNWWSTSATPPSTTATLTQPSTTGNAISNLGSNLLGSAINLGNANKWWQTGTTTTPTTVTTYPVVTTPVTGG